MKKLETNSKTLLSAVHEFNRANWEEGCICAGCGQLVKLYPYSLNRNAARSLILIYKLSKKSEDGWVHVQNEFASEYNLKATAMSYIILKHWGFIVPMTSNEDPDKNASGYWAITRKGIDFVMHRIEVPKTAMVYNNGVREFKGDHVTIAQSLTDKFSYKDLMGDLYIEPKMNLKLDI